MAQTGEYDEKLPHSIHETERDATPLSTPIQKPRRFWEKLGIYNIAVLVIGTVAICIALSFLLFIWGASTHARQRTFPQLWYGIVENKWATRVVTLSSVLIRVATAAQLGVFAALIAALILERVGVSTENLPLVSMIRCLNSGPHSLALSISNSIFTVGLFPYSILVVLAIINAFALQFTSTILLNDFGDTDVVMDYINDTIPFGLNRDVSGGTGGTNAYGGLDYWKTSPFTYQRFAEYKEKSSKGSNYIDTGKTLRGFPPSNDSSTRFAFREYNGPMVVVDTRVVCVKPTVSNLTIDSQYESIKGTFDWNKTHPDLKLNKALEGIGIEVNCSIPVSDWYLGKRYWQTSLCTVGATYARLSGGITPDDEDPDSATGHTAALLLLNATGYSDDWNASLPEGIQLQLAESSSPIWTRYARENVSVDFSLCFTNPMPSHYSVTASSDEDFFDGVLNYSNGSFNTSEIRKMYGATGETLTPAQRGQLDLKHSSDWRALKAEIVYNATTADFIWETLARVNYEAVITKDIEAYVGVGSTTMFSENALPQHSVHRNHAVIFQDTIQNTGDPSVALQTLFTILLQMAYYDFLYEYDVAAPAWYKVSAKLNIPHQWKALGVILSLLGLHFALVSTAVRMFLVRTEMSLLGNAWQAVSQVVSTDTAGVLHHGATTTDREVKDSMKQSGVGDSKIRIAKSVTSGRTEATAVRQRHGATYSAPVGQV